METSEYRSFLGIVLGIALITLLWGLDPVMGYILIRTHDLSTIDLTLIRFWSLTGISGLLLLSQKYKTTLPEARLPLRNPSLWISVLLLIAISLSTYKALQTTLPSHYTIPMTAAGVLLTSIVNRGRWKLLIASWTLLLAGVALLIAQSPAWPAAGVLATLVAVASFAAFSIVSEQYKRRENVAARGAQYFFILSLLGALLTLPLIPFSTINALEQPAIARMALFSIAFAGLPYYLYYFSLTHRQIDFVLRTSFLIIAITVGGQALLLGAVPWPVILPAGILVALGAALPLFPPWERPVPGTSPGDPH